MDYEKSIYLCMQQQLPSYNVEMFDNNDYTAQNNKKHKKKKYVPLVVTKHLNESIKKGEEN